MVKAIRNRCTGSVLPRENIFCTNLEEVNVEEIRAFFHHKYSLSVSIMNDVKCGFGGTVAW